MVSYRVLVSQNDKFDRQEGISVETFLKLFLK